MSVNGFVEVLIGEDRHGNDSTAQLRYRRPVLTVRRLLAQRYFAVLVCAATLLLKLLVPPGT
jgi:hypothetical protein